MMTRPTPYILFVDDDEDEHELIRQCCEELFIATKVRFLSSGDALFDFLLFCKAQENYPSLIVLDVNMPGLCGQEVLLRLKRNTQFCHIPVVMLSTCSRFSERYTNGGAEAFYTKPDSYQGLKQVIASLYEFLPV